MLNAGNFVSIEVLLDSLVLGYLRLAVDIYLHLKPAEVLFHIHKNVFALVYVYEALEA